MFQLFGSLGSTSDENTQDFGQNTTLSLPQRSLPVLLSLLWSFSSLFNSQPVVYRSIGGETTW
jgi:hypothetical protein